jgi:Heat induced stress protein YflT
MTETNSIVAVYETHVDAVQALNDLQNAGFDMMRLSVVAKTDHPEDDTVGYYKPSDRLADWGKDGEAWGAFGGFFAGAAFFSAPGIGPILMAGPLATAFVEGLDGAEIVAGMSTFGTSLYSLGIPKDGIRRYQAELCADRLLIIAHGTADELLQAKDVLHRTRPHEIAVHFGERVLAGAPA